MMLPNIECKNLLSARQNAQDVQELIDKDVSKGFLYGPFDSPPFESYRASPLVLAIGKYSGKKRLIVDLSSPHDNPDHVSINDLIDKDSCSMTYVKIDDTIRSICQHGKGALLTKFDISEAFKNFPIKSSQWPYFCVKWNSFYYVYVR